MPPTSFLPPGDCQAVSVGQIFDTLLASTINSMCMDNSGVRVCSPTYQCPKEKKGTSSPPIFSQMQSSNNVLHRVTPEQQHVSPSKGPSAGAAMQTYGATIQEGELLSVDTMNKPSNIQPLKVPKPTRPAYRNQTSFRDRKKKGLSIDPPTLPKNRQVAPHPSPIYCAKNVEMRRKSLSERHFFRPVSEDEDSTVGP